MTTPLFKRLPFDERSLHGRVEVCEDARRHITAQAFDWPGTLLETGRNYLTRIEGVAIAHHYLGLNAGTSPVVLRGVDGSRGRGDITLVPGAVWVVPAGDEVSLTIDSLYLCVRIMIAPRHAASLLESTRQHAQLAELRRVYGIQSPQLTHLMLALAAEAKAGTPGGLAFVDAMVTALSRQLVLHGGVQKMAPDVARGGLSPGARRRVLELIDAKLDARLSIGTLAREVDLSPAHFARAFKQTLGVPPHRFLLVQRLEQARRLLSVRGAQLSDVAARTGFADQAHFTRHFKRQFGVSPGSWVRSRCA